MGKSRDRDAKVHVFDGLNERSMAAIKAAAESAPNQETVPLLVFGHVFVNQGTDEVTLVHPTKSKCATFESLQTITKKDGTTKIEKVTCYTMRPPGRGWRYVGVGVENVLSWRQGYGRDIAIPGIADSA